MTTVGLRVRHLEQGLVVLAMLLMTDALVPLLYGNVLQGAASGGGLSESNPLKLIVSTVVLGLGTALTLRAPLRALQLLLAGGGVALLIVLWPLLSTLWSIEPPTTARRAVAHVLTAGFCLYVALSFRPGEFVRLLRWAIFLGCLASVVMALVLPSWAVEGRINVGAWVGVYGDKIMSGGVAALGVLLALAIPNERRWDFVLRWATLAACGLLLVMSQSRSGWLLTGMGVGVLVLGGWIANGRISNSLKLGTAGFGALVLGGGALALLPILLPLMGRGSDFSGRTKLWEAAIAVGGDRNPVFGSGFRAFWTETGAKPVKDYLPYWTESLVGNGHNGYLDTWLELGWVGLILLALFLIAAVAGLIVRIVTEPQNWAWRGLLVTIFAFLFINAAFSLAFKHSNVFWAACFLAFWYTAQAQLQARAALRAREPEIRRPVQTMLRPEPVRLSKG